MFTKNTSKKLFLVVAVLACAALLLCACNPSNAFTPVEKPSSATPEDNGGIAVRYGEWIYYVNGYQSSSSADNAYTNEIRTGAIVRIKVSDLNKLIAVNDADASSTNISDAIERAVAGKADTVETEALKSYVADIEGAELVVPNFYYTGDTNNTYTNGIYIFNDRIYITTPNTDLDANGNLLTSELVLTSYALDGSDMQRHFVFTSNAPQLVLSQNGSSVVATYVVDSKLYSFSFTEGQTVSDSDVNELTDDTISSATFSGDYIYFLDADGSICCHKLGDDSYDVLVKCEVEEGHEDHSHGTSYSIAYANEGYVYYTVSDDTDSAKTERVYCAKAGQDETTENVAVLNLIPSSYRGWNDKIVYTSSIDVEGTTLYGIWMASGDGSDKTVVLNPAENDSSITIDKIEGNILYYTVDSVSYTLDLSNLSGGATAYAYSLSTSSTGWSLPDTLDLGDEGIFTFTLSSGEVSIVKFDPETKTNSDSVTLTLTTISD